MLGYVLQALQGIFTIIIVVGAGFILNRRGWFHAESDAVISRLVTNVSLPCYLIAGLTRSFTAEGLCRLAPDLLLPVLSILLAMFVSHIVARLLHVRKGRRGVFTTNFFIANTVFIGLPVNLALFGDESIPAVMLYYMANTIFFWTFGVQNILADTTGSTAAFFSRTILKKTVFAAASWLFDCADSHLCRMHPASFSARGAVIYRQSHDAAVAPFHRHRNQPHSAADISL